MLSISQLRPYIEQKIHLCHPPRARLIYVSYFLSSLCLDGLPTSMFTSLGTYTYGVRLNFAMSPTNLFTIHYCPTYRSTSFYDYACIWINMYLCYMFVYMFVMGFYYPYPHGQLGTQVPNNYFNYCKVILQLQQYFNHYSTPMNNINKKIRHHNCSLLFLLHSSLLLML